VAAEAGTSPFIYHEVFPRLITLRQLVAFFRELDMELPVFPANMMHFATSTLALGGVIAFFLFAVTNSYSIHRTNRRYSVLGAKPPAVVSSNLFGIIIFHALNILALIAFRP